MSQNIEFMSEQFKMRHIFKNASKLQRCSYLTEMGLKSVSTITQNKCLLTSEDTASQSKRQ